MNDCPCCRGPVVKMSNGYSCNRCDRVWPRAGRRRAQPAEKYRRSVPVYEKDGCLPVECWCRTEVVMVPQRDVMAVRTVSCGLPRCRP